MTHTSQAPAAYASATTSRAVSSSPAFATGYDAVVATVGQDGSGLKSGGV